MAKEFLHDWQKKSLEHEKSYKQFLAKADKKKVLKILPEIHEDAVNTVNCLNCAACCKNYSPRFKPPDIKRVSKYLHMKEGVFIEKYLKIDEEGDFVVTVPCLALFRVWPCTLFKT